MSWKGFIFDFDGVIADSLRFHLDAWEGAYSQLYGKELKSSPQLSGLSTDQIGTILAEQAESPNSKQELIAAKLEHLRARAHGIHLLPGAREVFEALTKSGRSFGICSNASSDYIRKILSQIGIECPTIVGLRESPRPKPAPDGYVKCAEILGFRASEFAKIAVFEDSLHGLQAAVDAGMYPVGISTQETPKSLLNSGAKLVYSNLAEAMVAGIFDGSM